MPGIYIPSHSVHQAIRVSRIVDDYLTDDENLEQMLVASLFMSKVFQALREAKVNTQSATGSEVNLYSLMVEAETEVGVYHSPASMGMLNRWHGYKVESEQTRRRRYCYAIFYRMTSGNIIS